MKASAALASSAPLATSVPPARDRLIGSMRDSLQRRGLHGVGLTEVLEGAHAPKGVMYYHFPGGKTELAVAAIHATVDDITQRLDAMLAEADDPIDAMERWLAGAARQLERSGYERGCPLATVSLETTADDLAIRAALADAFARLRQVVAHALVRMGIDENAAAGLAALVVAAYEGGLMQSRVAQSSEAMRQVNAALIDAVRAMANRSNA